MKKQHLAIGALLLLLLMLVALPASAQGPTQLSKMVIKLWPEYDTPELLVIIDGRLATPGDEIRLPIPQEAKLNAVATDGGSGRLLKNDWQEQKTEDGGRLLVMTPQNPLFRVEYYVPLPSDGDVRQVDFELPAGYLNANEATIEIILPPGISDVSLTPSADESGSGQDEVHIFNRSLGAVADVAIEQKISYKNADGVMTAPAPVTTPATPAPATPAAPATSASKPSLNPWMIALAVAALLLILGGIVGLWLTSRRDAEEPEVAPARARGKKRKNVVHLSPASGQMDRFCRKCGEAFSEDDRFCRYCGTPRQSL
jgi:hypothetical protein